MEEKILLEIRNFSISFTQYERGLRQKELTVIRDLNVRVRAGELVAVVGSSGSGKSLLAHGILGILPYNSRCEGEILYRGEPLTGRRLKKLRGREIVLVPQSVAYLDPLMKVGRQVRLSRKDAESKNRVKALFRQANLPENTGDKYPFELSGGMARRVLVSTARMGQPNLVIADEPTPGMHLDAAKQTMQAFREMADGGAGVLLITHDLELAVETADRIVVFYAGETLEEEPASAFMQEDTLRHPYSKALWRAMPAHGFASAPGSQPYGADRPEGCIYGPRCPEYTCACGAEIPFVPAGEGWVRCLRCVEQGEGGEET